MTELVSFAEDMPEDLIRYAIDEACARGKRTWAYVRAILQGYIREDFKTVGEAKAESERRSKKAASPPLDLHDVADIEHMYDVR